jgi:hypothetical protein
MSAKQMSLSTTLCENLLKEDADYNTSHSIWPSHNRVIARLLGRSSEMSLFYNELYSHFCNNQHAIKELLLAVVGTTAEWERGEIRNARDKKSELHRLNREIALVAANLADLLEKREDLSEGSGFDHGAFTCIVDVIDSASKDNGHFTSFVKERLDALASQYDPRYWPSVAEVVLEMSLNATEAKVVTYCPIKQAATTSTKRSKSDFLHALFADIDRRMKKSGGIIPNDFRVSDASMAMVFNFSLDVSSNEYVGSEYIKRYRQRKHTLNKKEERDV